jgi:hypothetical protein
MQQGLLTQVKFQQRYVMSHTGMSSIAGGPGLSVNSAAPTATTRLVGQFWGLDSDRVFEVFLRQIVFSQKVDVLPGGRRPMGHGL